MTKKQITFVQEQLVARGLDPGPVDDALGPKTEAALDQVDGIERSWSRRRKAVGEVKRLRLDLWGGCLSVRMMRGGDRYSMHSWGIAIDYDPDRNKLTWGRDRATFARPEYDAWWEIWESEGWVSLGRQRNFDWMHVQAAKI